MPVWNGAESGHSALEKPTGESGHAAAAGVPAAFEGDFVDRNEIAPTHDLLDHTAWLENLAIGQGLVQVVKDEAGDGVDLRKRHTDSTENIVNGQRFLAFL